MTSRTEFKTKHLPLYSSSYVHIGNNGFSFEFFSMLQGGFGCRCDGIALVRIPQYLHAGMQKLTIAKAGLPTLRNAGLPIYANSLQDM